MNLQKWITIVLLLLPVIFFSGAQKYGEARQPPPEYVFLKKQIEEFIARKDTSYGIYFQDLKSGKSFGINDDVPMVAASTIKLPMSLYINTLVVEGKINWNNRVSYQDATDYEDGAGVLRYVAREGDRYSVRVLNTLSLTISDNVAFRMLARYVGRDNFIQFMKQVGGKTVYPGGRNLTTAKDMGCYLQATLDFVRRYPEPGKRLMDDLSHSIYHVGLPGKLPEHITVAHKEGDLYDVVGDVGVVFSSRPYILVVLSSGVADLDEGFRDIARISRIVYDFQEKL